jgi:hypothetical protein
VHAPGGVVVRIEKVSVLRNLGAVTRSPHFHDKRFEEPARVREVPFRRTHVRHRLDHEVFRDQVAAKTGREISDRPVTLEQLFGMRPRIRRPRLDFRAAARRLGHESLGGFQGELAFLFQLFLAGLDHLVVHRFLHPVLDKLLTEVLVLLYPRSAMSGR